MTALAQPHLGETFQAFLEKQYHKSKGGALGKAKENAWSRFCEIGLPSQRSEVFQYISLKGLFTQPFALAPAASTLTQEQIAPYILPECRESVIVFLNGHYVPALSNRTKLPSRLVLTTLNEATKTYGAFLNNQWAKSLQEERDPFSLLNAALHSEGAFLYLPPKTVVDLPLQILHVIDSADEAFFVAPRLHLFVGAQSEITLLSSTALHSGSKYGISQATEISVEEGAKVCYVQLSCEESAAGWHFDATRATLKRDSSLRTISVSTGAATVRNDYRVALIGENADASLNGVWMLNDKREAHTHVLVDHQAPHCHSMQLFKGVLNHFSRSSFEGKILVQQEAQKTDAFQLNNNLLLSNHATANSKPNLEVFADDVKASHGATMGQLDEEQLFFMAIRGLAKTEAQQILVSSFCKEVLHLIPIDSLLKHIEKRLNINPLQG
jgi:Fe-S cluster assembly protein SufD